MTSEQHNIHIIVNGQRKTVQAHENSFEELVAIAFDHNAPEGPDAYFTVSYRGGDEHGDRNKTLAPGHKVKLKEGMIFNVGSTDRS